MFLTVKRSFFSLWLLIYLIILNFHTKSKLIRYSYLNGGGEYGR